MYTIKIKIEFRNVSMTVGVVDGLVLLYCMESRPELDCGPMPDVMAALPNVGGALCSTPQTLADAHYSSAVQ